MNHRLSHARADLQDRAYQGPATLTPLELSTADPNRGALSAWPGLRPFCHVVWCCGGGA